MGALGVPQTPRRSSLIAHSFTSSYAPDLDVNTIFGDLGVNVYIRVIRIVFLES
jgi:hypothetical protein